MPEVIFNVKLCNNGILTAGLYTRGKPPSNGIAMTSDPR
jgi:hypothetical protein